MKKSGNRGSTAPFHPRTRGEVNRRVGPAASILPGGASAASGHRRLPTRGPRIRGGGRMARMRPRRRHGPFWSARTGIRTPGLRVPVFRRRMPRR